MEKQQNFKKISCGDKQNAVEIPCGYELCFNESCSLRERCMHYRAWLLHSDEHLAGPAVYPTAWKDGQCRRFSEATPVQKAWGFTHLYDNVPPYLRAEARRQVKAYFASGNGPYYRYHHGENTLSPRQQHDILQILAHFGPTANLSFDHYVTTYDYR